MYDLKYAPFSSIARYGTIVQPVIVQPVIVQPGI